MYNLYHAGTAMLYYIILNYIILYCIILHYITRSLAIWDELKQTRLNIITHILMYRPLLIKSSQINSMIT